ncbi:MAG: type II toxin-antitoxin system VapC family toxin [Betaproteobacteria bacterium]|nr:type II toxin-antitoxin system VapC family toxin [Betaproteobacteria bacterium]
MIVDSSAILAILFAERDAPVFAKAMSEADSCKISAATFVEVAVVVEAQTKDRGSRQLDTFLRRAGFVIEPVTEEQAHLARQAYSEFGKGRHPAGLNFGDCFSYALAKTSGEALLYKGGDFSKTDIISALG